MLEGAGDVTGDSRRMYNSSASNPASSPARPKTKT